MIRDLNTNPITNGKISVDSEGETILELLIDCETGYKLTCPAANSQVGILGRRQGDVTWVDLESDEIDLTPWDGTQQVFQIKTTAGVISAYALTQYKLRVSL